MAAAPTTRNWSMLENHRAEGPHLLVSGLVQVHNTGHAPHLTQAKPGGNPKILLLDLTVAPSGKPGVNVRCWQQARFEKDVKHGQYHALDVRWSGKTIGKATLVDDAQFFANLARLTQQANAAHPVRAPGKPPAKAEAPAKKAASKKAVTAKKRPAKAAAKKKRAAPKKAAARKAAPKKKAASKKKAAARKPAMRKKKSARKTPARRKK